MPCTHLWYKNITRLDWAKLNKSLYISKNHILGSLFRIAHTKCQLLTHRLSSRSWALSVPKLSFPYPNQHGSWVHNKNNNYKTYYLLHTYYMSSIMLCTLSHRNKSNASACVKGQPSIYIQDSNSCLPFLDFFSLMDHLWWHINMC